MLAPFAVALYLMLEAPHLSHAGHHHMSGLGAALLDSHLMPPSLLVESRGGLLSNSATKKTKPVSNATVGFALSTMGFHRQKMNEYLCRGYMAEDILERLQQDAEDVDANEITGVKPTIKSTASSRRGEAQGNSLQQRKGSRRPGRGGHPGNHRPNQLLTDEGSSNYKDWLTRSAVLEDIYRRYEQVSDDEDSAEDRQDDGRDDDYDGEVTGWAMEEPYWPKQDTGRHPDHDDLGESYHHHHHDYGGEPIIAASAPNNALSLGVRDVFDVALTAIAFLAFGIFILNVFLGILLPSSSTRTVTISNLTLPFRNRGGALDLSHEKKHERIARWIEEEPLERIETTEESAARLALTSIKAALGSTPSHCLQAALCQGNKESRALEGHAKYWLPVWSLGMSWLARRAGGSPGSEAGSASLFSGALENLRAATLGLAGARCNELFPSC